jgi:hypothetical protein
MSYVSPRFFKNASGLPNTVDEEILSIVLARCNMYVSAENPGGTQACRPDDVVSTCGVAMIDSPHSAEIEGGTSLLFVEVTFGELDSHQQKSHTPVLRGAAVLHMLGT